MTDSTESQKEQKTPVNINGGYPKEVRLETGGTLEAHQAEAASDNGHDSVQLIYTKEAAFSPCSNLLDWVLDRDNMPLAYKKVVANKGKHGIDHMTVDQLKPYLKENWETVKSQLLAGTYKPSAVRRVEIPKPDGGIRLLGIPTVLDRMIQ